MAIFDFGKYRRETYKGDIDYKNPNKYAYDSEYFKSLVANRQYEDAYKYARQFQMKDPEKQMELDNYLFNMRREGRKVSAAYARIGKDDEDSLQQVDFYNNIFLDGGLEMVDDNNVYKQEYKYILKWIGGEDSSKIRLTFNPKKQSFLGIDWLAEDNPDNIDNFLEKLGMTEDELKKVGVDIKHKDGKGIVTFHKSNALTSKILYNLNNIYIGRPRNNRGVLLEGLDDNNQKTKIIEMYPTSKIYALKDLINGTKETNDTFFSEQIGEKVYSSTLGGFIDDGLEMLKAQRNAGEITDSQYKYLYKTQFSDIEQTLKSISTANLEMYANTEDNETLHPLGNIDRQSYQNLIAATDMNDMELKAMVSNGKIGTLITINPIRTENENLNKNTSVEDMTKTKKIQVFIPGLFTKQAQAKINRNTLTRAAQEIDEMQDWGYDYEMLDGNTLYYNNDGTFKYRGEKINYDEAYELINKDMIKEDGSRLKYSFINSNNQIFDAEGFNNYIKIYAHKAANDLDRVNFLGDTEGNEFTTEEIFEMMSDTQDDVAPQYRHLLQFGTRKKLSKLYEIYNYLIYDAVDHDYISSDGVYPINISSLKHNH